MPQNVDAPGGTDTVVVIPALNEEESIALVVRDIPRDRVAAVIVADNGSTDRTAEAARASGAIVVHEPRRGYGYACLAGIARAKEFRPAIVAFLDGDYSDYPEELPSILEPIRAEGCDFVVGSRMTGRREPRAMPPQSLFGNALAGVLIRLFWGVRFTDLGPFRAIRAEALERLGMRDGTYGWTVEMQVKAAKLGLRCAEVPVRYRRRIGRSKVSGTLEGTVKASVKILGTIAKYLVVKV